MCNFLSYNVDNYYWYADLLISQEEKCKKTSVRKITFMSFEAFSSLNLLA